MRCPKCKKLLKENTYGDQRYCQGHSIFEDLHDGDDRSRGGMIPGLANHSALSLDED